MEVAQASSAFNPWEMLPTQLPFILPDDRPTLRDADVQRAGLKLHLHPVPFVGDPRTAKVILLGLNPGWSPATDVHELDGEYAEQNRLSLTFRSRTPFFSLDPALVLTPGHTWWTRRVKSIADRTGADRVASGLACIEWFPYHSNRFHRLPYILPSQRYGFDLVRSAIARGACLVVMRSRRLWEEQVPELATAHPLVLRVPRSAYLTPKNLGEQGFEVVCAALRLGAESS